MTSRQGIEFNEPIRTYIVDQQQTLDRLCIFDIVALLHYDIADKYTRRNGLNNNSNSILNIANKISIRNRKREIDLATHSSTCDQ